MKRAGRVGAMLVALVLGSASAHAEPGAEVDRERLAKLLRQGAEAARAKRWSACVEAYTGALSLEETATTQGELGICEDLLGRNVSAFLHLSAAMRAPAADRTKEPWKRFAVSLARVAPRVAQVFLTADPPQAAFVIDGRPAGRTEGRSFVLEPGPHRFAARLDGYTDAIQTLDLKPGDLPSIYLQLRLKPKVAPPLPPPAPVPGPKAVKAPPAWHVPAWSPRGAFVTATYVGAAATLASAATAIGLEVDRGALRRKLGPGHECGPEHPSPPASCAALHERTAQLETALGLTLGSAVATGLMAGVAGLAIGFERSPAMPTIAPSVGARAGGIVVTGTW